MCQYTSWPEYVDGLQLLLACTKSSTVINLVPFSSSLLGRIFLQGIDHDPGPCESEHDLAMFDVQQMPARRNDGFAMSMANVPNPDKVTNKNAVGKMTLTDTHVMAWN